MMPIASPGCTSNDTSFSAQNSCASSVVALARGANGLLHQRRHGIAQAVVPLAAAKFLPDLIEDDGGFAHGI